MSARPRPNGEGYARVNTDTTLVNTATTSTASFSTGDGVDHPGEAFISSKDIAQHVRTSASQRISSWDPLAPQKAVSREDDTDVLHTGRTAAQDSGGGQEDWQKRLCKALSCHRDWPRYQLCYVPAEQGATGQDKQQQRQETLDHRTIDGLIHMLKAEPRGHSTVCFNATCVVFVLFAGIFLFITIGMTITHQEMLDDGILGLLAITLTCILVLGTLVLFVARCVRHNKSMDNALLARVERCINMEWNADEHIGMRDLNHYCDILCKTTQADAKGQRNRLKYEAARLVVLSCGALVPILTGLDESYTELEWWAHFCQISVMALSVLATIVTIMADVGNCKFLLCAPMSSISGVRV
eukprot:SAG25_NODE_1650_length_2613_cov_118.762132_3_plen_355_part_00